MLLPLNLLLDDAVAVLRGEAVQIVARCLVYDDLVCNGIFEAHYAISGQWVATLCYDQFLMVVSLAFLIIEVVEVVIILVIIFDKEIPELAKIDLAIALITLKYTQSNSVCYAKGGQAIGIGAGQQSRIHCTRLAGQKADNWWLRQSPQVLGLQFVDGIGRADRDNSIDLYIGDEYMDVLAEGTWQNIFKVKPEVFTREEKRAWLDKMTDVALGSDAFFPFGDNIERAHKSGVKYISQPGGSVRDDNVISTCNKYKMAMAFTGIRLFHH